MLLYGGWLAIDGAVTVGTIVAFNAYVLLLQAPFRMLGFLMMLGQRASASAGAHLRDPRRAARRRRPARAPSTCVDPVGRVELDDVGSPTRDGPPVLDGFSLHIAPGETVAVVGATGAGKSTVARLLVPLLRRRRRARCASTGTTCAT